MIVTAQFSSGNTLYVLLDVWYDSWTVCWVKHAL